MKKIITCVVLTLGISGISFASVCPKESQVLDALINNSDIQADGLSYPNNYKGSQKAKVVTREDRIGFGGVMVDKSWNAFIDCSYGLIKKGESRPAQVFDFVVHTEGKKVTINVEDASRWSKYHPDFDEYVCGAWNKGTFDTSIAACQFNVN